MLQHPRKALAALFVAASLTALFLGTQGTPETRSTPRPDRIAPAGQPARETPPLHVEPSTDSPPEAPADARRMARTPAPDRRPRAESTDAARREGWQNAAEEVQRRFLEAALSGDPEALAAVQSAAEQLAERRNH